MSNIPELNIKKTDGKQLLKAATGIKGFDEITLGGLPVGRPTLVCGAAGSGKTLFSMTFLINGATMFNEPGVLMSFEETGEDLTKNVASLGYDLDQLIADNKIIVDYVRIERSEIEETGEYDLEGLFIRLDYAIKKIGAKRVILDTPDALFGGLPNEGILRAELRRLFSWLRERNVSSVITGERGKEGQLTRHGLEEYISDCVIVLENRVHDQITTRSLRVVKYRGSSHGTNEYPFLIDHQGINVLPITSAGLAYRAFTEVVPTGINGLNEMLGVGGYYRGSSILVSGSAGTGKTIFSSHFVDAACKRGERCIYFAFEESPEQIMRNMSSVGIDLRPHVESGLLRIESARPSFYGLEMHLTIMNREIQEFHPGTVVIDPISAFRGPQIEVHSALLRMVDLLKAEGITTIFTNLTNSSIREESGQGMSSLMDTWIFLTPIEHNGERNRGIYLLKSRGMNHSNQIREFQITEKGISFVDVYVGPEGVLTGSARLAQEAREKAEALRRRQEIERRKREFEIRKKSVERQIAELQASLHADEAELDTIVREAELQKSILESDREAMAVSRSLHRKSGNGR